MDRSIPGGDLIGRWSLSFADIDFVNSKPALTRLGLAAQHQRQVAREAAQRQAAVAEALDQGGPQVALHALRPELVALGRDAGQLLVRRQRGADGAEGLALLGTTSEANSLGLDERMELLEDLVDAGIEPTALMPGTGTCSITDTAMVAVNRDSVARLQPVVMLGQRRHQQHH